MTSYLPPNAGAGPLTLDKDIAWRINTAGSDVVTDHVVGAVAWMLTHGRLTKKERTQLLDGLGLEHVDNGQGVRVVQPKQEYRS